MIWARGQPPPDSHHWPHEGCSSHRKVLGAQQGHCLPVDQVVDLQRKQPVCLFGLWRQGPSRQNKRECSGHKIWSEENPGWRLSSVLVQCSPGCPDLAGPFPGGQIRGLQSHSQLGFSTDQLPITLVSSPPKIGIMIPTRPLGCHETTQQSASQDPIHRS